MKYEQELASDKETSKASGSAETSAAAIASTSAGSPVDITELAEKIEQGAAANQADDLELCSTSELLELFDDYYQDDKKRLDTDFLVSD